MATPSARCVTSASAWEIEGHSLLDLEEDLPTTAEDVAALRRLSQPKMSRQQWEGFVESRGSHSPEELRRRKGPRGEPFELWSCGYQPYG